MRSFLDIPHVRHLIDQAESADRLRQKLSDDHAATDDVDAALAQVLRDLGEAVWRMARSSSLGEAEPTEIPHTATRLPTAETRWFTDEIAIGEVLFDPGDLGDPHTRDELTADIRTVAGDLNGMTLDDVERDRRNPASALGALRAGMAPAWAADLNEFCRTVGPPDSSTEPQALSQEASRLKRAASHTAQWHRLPEDVRTAILGLLAARIRRASALLPDSSTLDRTMKELQVYRTRHDLPHVAPLEPRAAPERGAWEADARAWWTVLQRSSP